MIVDATTKPGGLVRGERETKAAVFRKVAG
jgi:hypothetical protein